MSVVTDTQVRSEERFRVTRSRRNVAWTGLGALVVVVVLALFPYIVYSGTTTIMVQAFIVLTMSSMWNLLAGYAGLVSVGQQAFVGLGAYFVLILAINGTSPFAALPVAAIACGAASLPLWWLVSRLRSGYFAIATWVLAATVMLIIERFSSIGGGTGLPLPGFTGWDPTLLTAYTYWAGLAVTILALAGTYLLLRGRLGLVLTAIRDDEVAAQQQVDHEQRDHRDGQPGPVRVRGQQRRAQPGQPGQRHAGSAADRREPLDDQHDRGGQHPGGDREIPGAQPGDQPPQR